MTPMPKTDPGVRTVLAGLPKLPAFVRPAPAFRRKLRERLLADEPRAREPRAA